MSNELEKERGGLLDSYEAYCRIEDRVELIDGVVYAMPSPSSMHQTVSIRMASQLEALLEGKLCRPFAAPMDVKLSVPKRTASFTIVQPDVFVVCDPSKIEKHYINGAPDFIIEILSDSTGRKDMIEKLNKYGEAGVREYWMLDIDKRILTRVLFLAGGFNTTSFVEAAGKVEIQSLDGLCIDFDRVFFSFQE